METKVDSTARSRTLTSENWPKNQRGVQKAGENILSVPALLSMPFFLCGGLKIVYDLLLFREFRAVKPPEEGKG